MIAIRAHYDGTVIVPDEPVPAAPQDNVIVLLDAADASPSVELERATREYYEGMPAADSDEGWGDALAADRSAQVLAEQAGH